MRLAACYSVFNGEELLQSSIDQIKDSVDEIVICFQKISNKGHENPDLVRFLTDFSLKNNVQLIEYEPNLSINTKENEKKKHNLMINYARMLGATHFFMSATDHFYHKSEFESAKNTVLKHDWDVTVTKMYTYFKYSTWQITPIEEYYMPFICKLYPGTAIESVPWFPVRVDPSVQINTCKKFLIFPEAQIMLHHYSMIRKDIRGKFSNAAASIRWTPDQVKKFIDEYENYSLIENPGITYFGGRKIKVVQDYFRLSIPST